MSEALLVDSTLTADYYTSDDVFTAELATVFRDHWLFAGHSCELAEPGRFLQYTLGTESLLVVRQSDGTLRAHHNVCRHRGSRVCAEPRGQARVFVCPYHQWTYALDGSLQAARLMGDSFVKDGRGLLPAAVREVAGLVFVCLSDEPPSFEPFAAAVSPQLGPHRLDTARIAHRQNYTVRANWKTLVENNRECYHCRGSHPEFLEANWDFGMPGDARASREYATRLAEGYAQWRSDGLRPADVSFPGGAAYRVSRLPLRPGYRTETPSGLPIGPALGSVGDDPGSLRLVTLPTMWAHANLDYAVTTRLVPVAPDVTDVEVCFLVHRDACDVDLAELTTVWTATSEQDWALCEANYAGVRSTAYRPGPLSPVVEASVAQFLDWYLAALGA